MTTPILRNFSGGDQGKGFLHSPLSRKNKDLGRRTESPSTIGTGEEQDFEHQNEQERQKRSIAEEIVFNEEKRLTIGYGVSRLFSFIFSIVSWFLAFFCNLLRLDLFAKRFCPDIYWSCVRPVRARSDYTELKRAVLLSRPVMEAIGYEQQKMVRDVKTLSKGNYSVQPRIDRSRLKKAEELFETMAAKPSVPLLRFMAYLTKKAWRWLYPLGIHVAEEEIRPVIEAARKGLPLLLLPTHKSHIDYLMVTYVCFEYALPIPYVVTGNNLDIPFIGSILRACGAFFYPSLFCWGIR